MSNQAMSPAPALSPALHSQTLTLKKPFFNFLGLKLHIYDQSGTLVAFYKHSLLNWKNGMKIYADESMQHPIMELRMRKISTFVWCYDVADVTSGQIVGTIQPKAMKSIIRDTWDLLGTDGQVVGKVEEKGSSLLRRFLPILTGKWGIWMGEQEVASMKQEFRFFQKEFTIDMSQAQGKIHPLFTIACFSLAVMAETNRERS